VRTSPRLLVLLLAAAAVPAGAAEGVRFLHDRHLDFVSRLTPPLAGDARCRACHAAEEPRPALRRSFCATCHEGQAPAWTPSPAAKPAATQPSVPFAHERHAASPRLSCGGCHLLGGASGLVRDRDCLGCHARTRVDQRPCAGCHRDDPKRRLPADHRDGWRRGHGERASEVAGRHGRDCATCHGEDACARCHRFQEPRDHTSIFKIRLHGTAASWERERCAACHESGTCIRCHENTRPLNHGANWRSVHMLAAGAVGNEHCGACHRPSFCNACHRGTP
jgi:hypothetical protein